MEFPQKKLMQQRETRVVRAAASKCTLPRRGIRPQRKCAAVTMTTPDLLQFCQSRRCASHKSAAARTFGCRTDSPVRRYAALQQSNIAAATLDNAPLAVRRYPNRVIDACTCV